MAERRAGLTAHNKDQSFALLCSPSYPMLLLLEKGMDRSSVRPLWKQSLHKTLPSSPNNSHVQGPCLDHLSAHRYFHPSLFSVDWVRDCELTETQSGVIWNSWGLFCRVPVQVTKQLPFSSFWSWKNRTRIKLEQEQLTQSWIKAFFWWKESHPFIPPLHQDVQIKLPRGRKGKEEVPSLWQWVRPIALLGPCGALRMQGTNKLMAVWKVSWDFPF